MIFGKKCSRQRGEKGQRPQSNSRVVESGRIEKASLLEPNQKRSHVCVLSCFSSVQLFVTLWTIVGQAPLSMGFSRQGYQSGLPCPPPGVLPNGGTEPTPFMSPALKGRFFATCATWEAQRTPQWKIKEGEMESDHLNPPKKL